MSTVKFSLAVTQSGSTTSVSRTTTVVVDQLGTVADMTVKQMYVVGPVADVVKSARLKTVATTFRGVLQKQ